MPAIISKLGERIFRKAYVKMSKSKLDKNMRDAVASTKLVEKKKLIESCGAGNGPGGGFGIGNTCAKGGGKTDGAMFKKWFGDSKVVDADGKPLAVYHGTYGEGFEVFDLKKSEEGLWGKGMYFAERENVASAFAISGENDGARVYSAYLKVEKPFDIDKDFILSKDLPAEMRKKIEDRFWAPVQRDLDEYDRMVKDGEELWGNPAFTKENEQEYRDQISRGEVKAGFYQLGASQFEERPFDKSTLWQDSAVFTKASDYLRSAGYDGLKGFDKTQTDTDVLEGGETWVVFKSNQIKSATGNKGTFDSNSDDIRESDCGAGTGTGGGFGIGNTCGGSKTDGKLFKKWFGDSKAVDENGNPLVLYHGTGSNFNKFEFSPENTGLMMSDKGFYFSDKPSEAGGFAKAQSRGGFEGAAIMPVYLKLENPLIFGSDNDTLGYGEFARMTSGRISELKNQGYDGAIFQSRHDPDTREYMAFESNQIKSATGNNGNFDIDSDNILEAKFRQPKNLVGQTKMDFSGQKKLDFGSDSACGANTGDKGVGFGKDNDCGKNKGQLRKKYNLGKKMSSGLMSGLRTKGGFSYNPISKTSPKTGYMVSTHPELEETIDFENIDRDKIVDYLIKNIEHFDQENIYGGGWHKLETGEVFLDVSTNVQSRSEAMSLAKKHNQDGIYDLIKGIEIATKSAAERDKRRGGTDTQESYTETASSRSRRNPKGHREDVGLIEGCGAGTGEGGGFGPGNTCATGKAGSAAGYSRARLVEELEKVTVSKGLDPGEVWDRKKGFKKLPDQEMLDKIAAEQQSYEGKEPDAETLESYEAFKAELLEQYDALKKSGLKVYEWEGDGEPYKVSDEKIWSPSSDRMRADVERDGEFRFFMTEKGFGDEGASESKAHPFLAMSPAKTTDGKPMLYNDVFRVVHDGVAHIQGGFSFSTRGEMNAMLVHASTISKKSRAALWAETFGQNAVYEKTGKYAAQNIYTSKHLGLIDSMLGESGGLNESQTPGDSDEPLGFGRIKRQPRGIQESCGANIKGGGGFQASNDCAAGDGSGGTATKPTAKKPEKSEKTFPSGHNQKEIDTVSTMFKNANTPPAAKSFIVNQVKNKGNGVFQTGKGSIYLYQDGMSKRYKTKHKGHDAKDKGWKKGSDSTVFVDKETANWLGMHQSINLPKADQRPTVAIIGNKIHLAVYSKTTKKVTPYKEGRSFTPKPSNGSNPVEFWGDPKNSGNRVNWHPGSTISGYVPPRGESITEACGANQEGGGGFTQGNTCAGSLRGKHDAKKSKKMNAVQGANSWGKGGTPLPWDASESDIKAGKIPGVKWSDKLGSRTNAQVSGEMIEVGPRFIKKDKELKKVIMRHEVGHFAARLAFNKENNKKTFEMMEPFRIEKKKKLSAANAIYNNFAGYDGKPEEFISDVYAMKISAPSLWEKGGTRHELENYVMSLADRAGLPASIDEISESCGANATGGGGFQAGNTCATGEGGTLRKKHDKKIGIQTDHIGKSDSFEDEIKFFTPEGNLRLAKNKHSFTDWSVLETYVNEESRRKGIARSLVKHAKKNLKGTIGAQVSSDKSLDLFWSEGFRNESNSKDQAYKHRKEDSSTNLIYDPGVKLSESACGANQKGGGGFTAGNTCAGGGTATAEKTTGSKLFQKWFDGSKVVDGKGEPMVVYHSTAKDFNVFRKSMDFGYHFGTAEQANYRVQGGNTGAHVKPVYLSLKKPIEMPDHVWDDPRTMADYFTKNDLDKNGVVEKSALAWEEAKRFGYNEQRRLEKLTMPLKEYRDKVRVNTVAIRTASKKNAALSRAALQTLGYDGVKYKNKVEGEGYSFVAFDPSDIKSATGNAGTFNPASDNITEGCGAGSGPGGGFGIGNTCATGNGGALAAAEQKLDVKGKGKSVEAYRAKMDEIRSRLYGAVAELQIQGYRERFKRLTAGIRELNKIAGKTGFSSGRELTLAEKKEFESLTKRLEELKGEEKILEKDRDVLVKELDEMRESGLLDAIAEDPAFKEWSEGYAVSDDNDKLVVVYHGTEEADFNEFNEKGDRGEQGIFTSPNIGMASSYANGSHTDQTPVDLVDFEDIKGSISYEESFQELHAVKSEIEDSPYTHLVFDTRQGAIEHAMEEYEYDAGFLGAGQDVVPYYKFYESDGLVAFEGADKEKFLSNFNAFPGLRRDINESGSGVYPMVGKMKDPIEYDAMGANWDRIPLQDRYMNGGTTATTRELSADAYGDGHDGLIIRNVIDYGGGGGGDGLPHDVYVFFGPNQLKSIHNKGEYSTTNDNIMEDDSCGAGTGAGGGFGKGNTCGGESGGTTNGKLFQKWFGDSKVVDDDGKPLVVFHGTSNEFDVFDDSRSGENTGHPLSHLGFHFIDSHKSAKTYARDNEPMKVFLDIKNPARVEYWEISVDDIMPFETNLSKVDRAQRNEVREIKNHYQGLGHDGLIFPDGDGKINYVVFDPSQIKSATRNKGTFDAGSDDITESDCESGSKGKPGFQKDNDCAGGKKSMKFKKTLTGWKTETPKGTVTLIRKQINIGEPEMWIAEHKETGETSVHETRERAVSDLLDELD